MPIPILSFRSFPNILQGGVHLLFLSRKIRFLASYVTKKKKKSIQHGHRNEWVVLGF